MKRGPQAFKAGNMRWLVALAAADLLAIALLVVPGIAEKAGLTTSAIGRASMTTVLPVIVLLLVNLLPPDVKAMLVFWKPLGVLPGSQAFTKHGPADPRIDMTALRKHVGVLPTEPAEQNRKWYALSKAVSGEPLVVDSHKAFLLYRDMTALSVALLLLVPIALRVNGVAWGTVGLAAAMFAGQYVVTMIAARSNAVRFVCNVLALHSARKIGKAPAR